MSKRVLLLLRDDTTRRKWQLALTRRGWEVFAAPSIEPARKLLGKHWIPLLLIAVRLRDENDEQDETGLIFADEEDICQPSFRLLLTAEPDRVRRWLQANRQGAAGNRMDVLSKEAPLAENLERLDQIFAAELGINRSLALSWEADPATSPASLAGRLFPRLDTPALLEPAQELEDLMRRQFRDYQSLAATRLRWWRAGQQVAFSAEAQMAGEPERQLLVVLGQRAPTWSQSEAYLRRLPHMPLGQRGGGLPWLILPDETAHLAGFVLTGLPLGQWHSLNDRLTDRSLRLDFPGLVTSIHHLQLNWGHGQGLVSVEDQVADQVRRHWAGLTETSRLDVQNALRALAAAARPYGLALTYGEPSFALQITRSANPDSFPNPLPWLMAPGNGLDWCEPVLARLAADSLFVDDDGQAWPTEPSAVQLAPPGWTMATLEALARFDLLKGASLEDRHELEQALTRKSALEPVPSADLPSSVKRIAEWINAMREAERALHPAGAASYAWALMAQAMMRAAGQRPASGTGREAILARLHALLAAGLICLRQLPEPNAPVGAAMAPAAHGAAEPRLWYHEAERCYRRGEQPLDLSRKLLVVFTHLFEHARRWHTKAEVFALYRKETYDPNNESHANSVHNTIRLIREQIEINPRRPRYLVTNATGGYCLWPDPDHAEAPPTEPPGAG